MEPQFILVCDGNTCYGDFLERKLNRILFVLLHIIIKNSSNLERIFKIFKELLHTYEKKIIKETYKKIKVAEFETTPLVNSPSTLNTKPDVLIKLLQYLKETKTYKYPPCANHPHKVPAFAS